MYDCSGCAFIRVLFFYCWITNYQRLSGLHPHTFSTLASGGQESGHSLQPGYNPGVGQSWVLIWRLYWQWLCFQALVVIGRIHYLMARRPRALASCWPLTAGHSSLVEAFHSSLPCVFPQILSPHLAACFSKANKGEK